MHHHIRLTVEARLDLQWWLTFLPQWSGQSLLDSHWTLHTKMKLFTDASGHDGWGAYWSGRWLQDHWSPAQQQITMAYSSFHAMLINKHCMEGTVCHCYDSTHMGQLMATAKNIISL